MNITDCTKELTYEVIWSYREDKYLVRPFIGLSLVKPKLVGTLEECNRWAAQHN